MLLTSFLKLFLSRREVKFDWIPIVWACYIMIILIQYYSATWNLNSVTEWTFLHSSLPLTLASMIFLSAGLVLPGLHSEYPSDLSVYFDQDGKWAVMALAIRAIIAVCTNIFLLSNSGQFSIVDAFIIVQLAMALMFFFSKKRKFKIAFTLLYGWALIVTNRIIYLN